MPNPLMNILDDSWQRSIENVRETAQRIWARPLHRYFTDHTVEHSERIINHLNGLTAVMMHTDKRLTPIEVYTLLAAAYLHDIGMQNERFADGDLEMIRDQHHSQSAELIYAAFKEPAIALAIPLKGDPAVAEAVALVSKGHRKVDLNGIEYDPLYYGDEKLRLRLL